MAKVMGVELVHGASFGVFGSKEAAEAFLKVLPSAPKGWRFAVVVASNTEWAETISVQALEIAAEWREYYAKCAYYGAAKVAKPPVAEVF